MRSSHRLALLSSLGVLFAGSGLSHADGTVNDGGAVIAAGAGVPQGVVSVDGCAGPRTAPSAPSITALGSIGTITGSIPNFSGGGSGNAFHATTDATLTGGTYDFSSYTIDSNITVTYLGAVTIRTSGDVQIGGTVTTTSSGASITILAGGNLSVTSNKYGIVEGVVATGASAPVTVDVAGQITSSSGDAARSQFRSYSAEVALTSHTAVGGISLLYSDLRSPVGVTVRTNGTLDATDVVVSTDGDILVQAFGGQVGLADTTAVTFDGNVVVEGARGVVVSDYSDLHAEGSLTIKGFGNPQAAAGTQDVVVDSSSLSVFSGLEKMKSAQSGDLSVLSATAIRVVNSASIAHLGVGDLELTAFGSTVAFETDGSQEQSEVEHDGAGELRVAAQTDVRVYGTSSLQTYDGRLDVRAVTGSVSVSGGGYVASYEGAVSIAAAGSVTCAPNAGTGAVKPDFAAGDLTITAGAGGIDLTVETLVADTGPVSLLTPGALRLRGAFESYGPFAARSLWNNVDVAGASIGTTDRAGTATAAIAVESYGATTSIDASGATIVSGDSTGAASGGVTLAVYSAPPPVTRAFVLPKKVAVKLNAKDATKSTVTISGWIDTGPDAADLSGTATLTCGDLTAPVTLVADAKGVLRHSADGLDLAITASKTGSSKCAFTLKRTGDLSALVDATGNGAIVVRFVKDALDASGRVRVAKGKYSLGKTPGALITPSLFLYKAKATLSDVNGDTLTFSAGLSTNGPVPQTAPEVRIGFGDTFEALVDPSKFGPAKKGVFTAKNPVPGISQVKLDYAKETITVTGKGLELGVFPQGSAIPVTVTIQLGNDLRRNELRMGMASSTIGY